MCKIHSEVHLLHDELVIQGSKDRKSFTIYFSDINLSEEYILAMSDSERNQFVKEYLEMKGI